jgi:ATP synthase protein I
MPNPEEQRDAALKRLDERLGSLEASRARKVGGLGAETKSAGDGYRLLGELVGGILGGLGLGWVFDHYLGTMPWGLIGGLLAGLGISVFSVVRQATRMSAKAAEQGRSAPSAEDKDA